MMPNININNFRDEYDFIKRMKGLMYPADRGFIFLWKHPLGLSSYE